MNRNIKWGCIQPLTGGMYIGAEKAIGHSADWIISYPGLCDIKKDKDGNIISAGNEYNLLKWCEKHNEIPPYMVFDKKIFDTNTDIDNIKLIPIKEWNINEIANLNDTDIIVSVPVCSGLSMVTIASEETKEKRNCNMIFNAKYALGNLKPKVYIFENAPGLFTDSGKNVRKILNNIAETYGYSIGYFKTDTCIHDNPQRRPRTFVVFVKYRNGEKGFPKFNSYKSTVALKDFFNKLSDSAKEKDIYIEMSKQNKLFLNYIKNKYGENYREAGTSVTGIIRANNLWDDAIDYMNNFSTDNTDIDEETIQKTIKYLLHCKSKVEDGKNFYSITPWWAFKNDTTPACMFKTIYSLLNPYEDRLMSLREWLHIMGLPEDFELYGELSNSLPKIGQNVPVDTAKYIVSEAVRFVNEWDNLDRSGESIIMFDNIKNKYIVK